jgi:hypothetical protein
MQEKYIENDKEQIVKRLKEHIFVSVIMLKGTLLTLLMYRLNFTTKRCAPAFLPFSKSSKSQKKKADFFSLP